MIARVKLLFQSVAIGLAFIALTGIAAAAPISISGQVTYRERLALPPDAVLSVRLLDVSLADARAIVHAEARLPGPGQVPLNFSLNFDDKVIVPNHNYALQARIMTGGKLLFLNTTHYPVKPLAPEKPISIVVDLVGQVNTAPTTPPVATAPEPKSPPPAPPAQQQAIPVAALFGITWHVERISNAAVLPDSRTTMELAEDGRTGGKGGCNNYFAQAEYNGTTITFGAPAATRMACSGPVMAQETQFFNTLAFIRSFTLSDNTLHFLDATGAEVLELTPAR
ncbi:MAG TPA: YbaY family lipoprotein [Devosiaceae bacterium]|jgi:putative lipoprotein